MNRPKASITTLSLGAVVLLAGCMPKMTIEEFKATKPQRPAELDQLNAFAGNWEWEGQAKFAVLDQVLKITGTSEAEWEGDGWYLVIRNLMDMEELGDMKAVEAWTYDAKTKRFRSTWVDSMGSVATGEAWHDQKTDTWHMRSTSYTPFGKTSMKGTARFIDPDHTEWRWSEYTMGGLVKTMEMWGTGKRQ